LGAGIVVGLQANGDGPGAVEDGLDGHLDQAGVWLDPDVLGLGKLTLVRPVSGGLPPAEGGPCQHTAQ
jgi:hypothetical protein